MQADEEFKVVLSYILSSRSAWATRDPVSKERQIVVALVGSGAGRTMWRWAEGSVRHIERVARNPGAPHPWATCWGPTCLVFSPTL